MKNIKRPKRKVIKNMMTTVSIIGILILIISGILYAQNQKPQIKLGYDGNKFGEIPTKPNCVSTQTSQLEKKVDTLEFKESIKASQEAMIEALKTYGGIEIIEKTDNYIYAVATTSSMHFHDDIEMFFDEKNKAIQYRSASRAGYSDRGLNRERYYAIAKMYNEK